VCERERLSGSFLEYQTWFCSWASSTTKVSIFLQLIEDEKKRRRKSIDCVECGDSEKQIDFSQLKMDFEFENGMSKKTLDR